MDEMSDKELSDKLKPFQAAARSGARSASDDPEVIEESADHALMQLGRKWDSVGDHDAARRSWVRKTAANHAMRVGAKLDREPAFGRQGSRPPLAYPKEGEGVDNLMKADEHIGRLIRGMRLGGLQSLGSFVAFKVDFDERWNSLSEEARELLEAKYVDGFSSAEIAENRGCGESAGAIDHRLTAAKKAARPLFEDLLSQLRGGPTD